MKLKTFKKITWGSAVVTSFATFFYNKFKYLTLFDAKSRKAKAQKAQLQKQRAEKQAQLEARAKKIAEQKAGMKTVVPSEFKDNAN